MSDIPVITIDGPSGSGKGTIAHLLAQELGWHTLDSGALYRLVALGAQHNGIGLDDVAGLAQYAIDLDVVFASQAESGVPQILLEGADVTDDIRREEVGNAASKVAALVPVREALLARQRAFQKSPGLVADGRDMGSVVFPDARVKIFLTASAEERAKRRYKQLKEKGISANLKSLFEEIAERDARDTQRAVSPLKPAQDAINVETSDLGIDEVLKQIKLICRQYFGRALSV